MTRVAEKIDAHLGERFAMELNRVFELGCCDACRAKIDGPVPSDAWPPEGDARRLMLDAARTRHCIPARERWQVDPELKKSLKALYHLYQRGMLGPCPGARDMHVTAATVTAESPEMLLWWELTKDGSFLDRLNQVFDPYRGRVAFERFRDSLLEACLASGISDPNGASALLEEQAPSFATEDLN